MPQNNHPDPADETQALLEYVADRDVFCPRCGYNLRALASPRCPECGDGLKLTVGTLSPINRVWIMLVVAVVLPAGLGALLTVVLINEIQYLSLSDLFSIHRVEDALGIGLAIYCMACVPLSILALWMRRPFYRLPHHYQCWLAATPTIIDVLGLLFFLSML